MIDYLFFCTSSISRSRCWKYKVNCYFRKVNAIVAKTLTPAYLPCVLFNYSFFPLTLTPRLHPHPHPNPQPSTLTPLRLANRIWLCTGSQNSIWEFYEYKTVLVRPYWLLFKKSKTQNPSFHLSTASSGMRKYSARAIYMQRRCRVKCIKDVTYVWKL